MGTDDLDWLVAERPQPVALDPAATERSRQALMRHALSGSKPRTARRRRLLTPRILLRPWLALGLVGAAAALILVLGSPRATMTPGHVSRHKPAVPVATGPLARLAGYVRDDARPSGDATLVLRTQSYPDGSKITGADLYTDSGEYFYAPTLSGLPSAIAANENVGNGFMGRELAVARYAANGNLTIARKRMAVAALDPKYRRMTPAQSRAALRRSLRAALAKKPTPVARQLLNRQLRMLARAGAINEHAQIDNEIWENSLDTIVAGAGNPIVRAGILRLLSTMSDVKVADTTTDGRPSLRITATAPALPKDYQEQLTINANTGLPIRFTGGVPGKAPSVIVTYTVSRVTLARIAAG